MSGHPEIAASSSTAISEILKQTHQQQQQHKQFIHRTVKLKEGLRQSENVNVNVSVNYKSEHFIAPSNHCWFHSWMSGVTTALTHCHLVESAVTPVLTHCHYEAVKVLAHCHLGSDVCVHPGSQTFSFSWKPRKSSASSKSSSLLPSYHKFELGSQFIWGQAWFNSKGDSFNMCLGTKVSAGSQSALESVSWKHQSVQSFDHCTQYGTISILSKEVMSASTEMSVSVVDVDAGIDRKSQITQVLNMEDHSTESARRIREALVTHDKGLLAYAKYAPAMHGKILEPLEIVPVTDNTKKLVNMIKLGGKSPLRVGMEPINHGRCHVPQLSR
eukprot:1521120-Amphidinium_carterae.1